MQLGWLAKELSVTVSPALGVPDTHCHAWIFKVFIMWVLGTQAQIRMVTQQAVYLLSHLPRTFILFLFYLDYEVMDFVIAFHYYVFCVPIHSHPSASLTSPFLCFNILLSFLKPLLALS